MAGASLKASQARCHQTCRRRHRCHPSLRVPLPLRDSPHRTRMHLQGCKAGRTVRADDRHTRSHALRSSLPVPTCDGPQFVACDDAARLSCARRASAAGDHRRPGHPPGRFAAHGGAEGDVPQARPALRAAQRGRTPAALSAIRAQGRAGMGSAVRRLHKNACACAAAQVMHAALHPLRR